MIDKKRYIIGLDIGTTSIKAVAYRRDGTEVLGNSELVHTETGADGSAIQHLEPIYQSVMRVLRATITDVREQHATVEAIGFSSAMHSTVALNAQDHPLYPAITWLDVRPQHVATALWNSDLGKDIYERTGTPIHAMTPVAKIAWFRDTYPNLFAETARFVSVKEYVWHRWFGEWEVDYAVASATGLMHGAEFAWYPPALDYARIRPGQLSAIVPTSHVRHLPMSHIFHLADSSDTLPICIGGSDGVLATLAANALNGKRMILTIGTSLAIRFGHSVPTTNPEIRNFAYPLSHHQYVVGAPSNSGGAVLDWLYRCVLTEQGEGFERRFPQLCEDAGTCDSDDLFCIPYISGERAPIWNESASASLIGLKRHHGQGHVMRAAMEGILFNAYWIAQSLIAYVGKPDRLVVSGKLFQTTWVRQWTADLFDMEMEAQPEVDGATLGAAMIASRAVGDEPILPNVNGEWVTRPTPGAHQRLQRKFERFHKLCSVVVGANG